MTGSLRSSGADQGQRRASFQQARSHATKQTLVQSALALWRTNGYAKTTVADICRAAGVSKALFYFYFPRKEDVLFEVGVMSTDAIHSTARAAMRASADLATVIHSMLASLEETMRTSTTDLLLEAILEGYRQSVAGQDHLEQTSAVFREIFEWAREKALLPVDFDSAHVAVVAQSLVSEGARYWAMGAYGDRCFADVVGRDIVALIEGHRVTR